MASYRIQWHGDSASFAEPHPFVENASRDGSAVVLLGDGAGAALAGLPNEADCPFVAVELGSHCLGEFTGEDRGREGSNVVGFARFRLGDAAPSRLIELVRQPASSAEAIAAAKAAFEAAGLAVAVCHDFPGRIVDRLIRPYLNAVLRRLDERLATADDLDNTLRLGLGYPEGPIALLERTGLHHHHDVTLALFQALGQEPYYPARRAQVARRRSA
jgi:3-hydroxybutyryl-CoA dehydrogenase